MNVSSTKVTLQTYQDYLTDTDSGQKGVGKWIFNAIEEHKASKRYAVALDAERYARQENTSIMAYQKMLYTLTGKAVPDSFSANHKMASNFFDKFITQENQYLLGNGVFFRDDKTKDKLSKSFDTELQKIGEAALIEGVAFGFYNFGKIECFKFTEFVPLWDEYDGSLKAGIRFWQIADNKPMRATLYELDGYTEYVKGTDGEITVLKKKRTYKQIVKKSIADGEEISDWENYPSFPIVPLWGNTYHQSELVGRKEAIDAYDFIKSGFANDLDDFSQIYWVLTNTGGMDDLDLAKFVERMKTVKAAVVDGDSGVTAQANTVDIPYESRTVYLDKIKADLYEDFQALNVSDLSAGDKTATEIRAAYQPLDNKVDKYEYCVIEFVLGILAVAGIDDYPSFKRSKIVNQLEETQMILMAASYIDEETLLNKLPWLTPDEISGIQDRKAGTQANRYSQKTEPEE